MTSLTRGSLRHTHCSVRCGGWTWEGYRCPAEITIEAIEIKEAEYLLRLMGWSDTKPYGWICPVHAVVPPKIRRHSWPNNDEPPF